MFYLPNDCKAPRDEADRKIPLQTQAAQDSCNT